MTCPRPFCTALVRENVSESKAFTVYGIERRSFVCLDHGSFYWPPPPRDLVITRNERTQGLIASRRERRLMRAGS
jgi:hypothetical protein